MWKKFTQFCFHTCSPIRVSQGCDQRRDWNRTVPRDPEYDLEIDWTRAVDRFCDPNDLYRYLEQYFHYRCPEIIREHRLYFSQKHRGFGEDAMHAMWWLLFLERRPNRCLEIGVYRGQVLSLWALLAKLLCLPCETHGVTPLSNVGDTVSPAYLELNYDEDIAGNFSHFDLPQPTICRSLSTETAARLHVQSTEWDLIYIDGAHDFEIVLADYKLCKESLAENGLLVFDDAALSTQYQPLPGAFAGHPGPSRVAQEYARREMIFVAGVGHNLIFRNRPR